LTRFALRIMNHDHWRMRETESSLSFMPLL